MTDGCGLLPQARGEGYADCRCHGHLQPPRALTTQVRRRDLNRNLLGGSNPNDVRGEGRSALEPSVGLAVPTELVTHVLRFPAFVVEEFECFLAFWLRDDGLHRREMLVSSRVMERRLPVVVKAHEGDGAQLLHEPLYQMAVAPACCDVDRLLAVFADSVQARKIRPQRGGLWAMQEGSRYRADRKWPTLECESMKGSGLTTQALQLVAFRRVLPRCPQCRHGVRAERSDHGTSLCEMTSTITKKPGSHEISTVWCITSIIPRHH